MATYRTTQRMVKEQSGFVPKTCWIADVKEQLGFPVRRAHNRVTHDRSNPCPPERRAAIGRAIKALNQTQSSQRNRVRCQGSRKWSN